MVQKWGVLAVKSIRTWVTLGVAGAVLATGAMFIGSDDATAAGADKTIAYRKMVMRPVRISVRSPASSKVKLATLPMSAIMPGHLQALPG